MKGAIEVIFGFAGACLFWLCAQKESKPAQSLETFVGSKGCRAELRGKGADFGLALDRKQNVYAEVREIGGKLALLVIQYASENDRCGVVRDVVVTADPKDVFEFECTDHRDTKRVVLGVHQGAPGARQWKATKAWIVDFEKLKLTPTDDAVSCQNYSYAGSDDGSDVKTRAADRAKSKSR